jgi:hypothetical protein
MFNPKEAIDIATCLFETVCSWKRTDLENLPGKLNMTLIQTTPNRSTFKLGTDNTCSLYFSGDDLLSIECTVIVFLDPDQLSSSELRKKYKEFINNYKELVSGIKKKYGTPSFEGNYGDPGFPEGRTGINLAQWSLEKGIGTIQFKHEDKELPLRLCIGLYPPVIF